MPTPHAGESKNDFISRCIPLVLDDGTTDDNTQAVAICYSMWEQAENQGSGESAEKAFSTFKDASGNYRWVAVSSNAYLDREGQIVSQKALESDVARIEPDNDYGPLRWWHVGGYDLATQKATPGIDIGDCDFRMMRGKFLIESGTYRTTQLAEAFKEFDGQVSVRFLHPINEPDQEGVFHHIKIFERSILPRGRAANPFTSFKSLKESLPMTEKMKEFEAIIGDPALVESMISAIDAHQKALDTRGVTSKEESPLALLLSKLKGLGQPETKAEPQTVEPQVTAKEIADAVTAGVTAGVTAALQAMQAEQAKSELAQDTEKAQNEAIKNLTARIEKLQGDFSDTQTELQAAQKELAELTGAEGYRPTKVAETILSDTQKEQALNSGLEDFTGRMFGKQ